MKRFNLILLMFFFINCKAQKSLIEDLSSESKMNYTFALIDVKNTMTKELYNQVLYVNIYQLYDPEATPDSFSPTDGEDVLDSYIISVKSSDTFTNSNDSKLYKIKGLYDSKILEVKESTYPNFSIKIEHGESNKRRVNSFELSGAQKSTDIAFLTLKAKN